MKKFLQVCVLLTVLFALTVQKSSKLAPQDNNGILYLDDKTYIPSKKPEIVEFILRKL